VNRDEQLDHTSLDNWDGYTEAAATMFAATHTPNTPWAVVNSNDERTARLNAIRHVLHALPYDGKDKQVAVPADPDIVTPPGPAEPNADPEGR
jgi:polyphosphate kinase